MRYSLLSQILLFLMFSMVLEAQTDISIKKKEFKIGETGFEDAWNHTKDGDSYYMAQGVWYGNAFDEYLKAIVYNNSNPELNYKTGVSALFSDNREEAAGFLEKAYEIKNDVTDDILLLKGRALQYAGRFAEAIESFDSYLKLQIKKKSDKEIESANKWKEECNSALIVTKDTLRISIENLGVNINSSADDYSGLFSGDGKSLYYASRREIPKSSNYYSDSKFDENIYISKEVDGSWQVALPLGKEINTKYCEAPLFLNNTNDILYIYTGYSNGGDIKMSVNKKGIWKEPVPVRYNINSSGSETSFVISPSGNEIYFVSDKGKENFGGKDIYFIRKLSEKKWSKPQNAGSLINTSHDEEAVRFSQKGDTMWFSSKGHSTIGGFDIFYSIKNGAGEWDTVRNCGYPVNSQWDDIFFHPSKIDDSTFYLVSNRSGGFGGLDIYKGLLLPPEPVVIVEPTPLPVVDTVVVRDTVVIVRELEPEPVKEDILFLIGRVRDSETNEPVLSNIEVVDIVSDTIAGTTTSSGEDGSFRVRLPAKKSYMVSIRAAGFLSDMKAVNIPKDYDMDFFNLDATLIKVKVGKKVVLNNILFETGKSILTTGSYAEIDRLLTYMEDSPQMKIEISGHTDKTGSEPVNFRLSEERAKAVVDYLVQKGIDRSRMEFRGYGSLQPIDDNSTPQGRAKNRRVEFKILEF